MDNEEQIRRVLVESQPSVDEEQGWAGVQTRADRAGRRHRVTRGLMVITAVAVFVGFGFGVRSWLSGSSEIAGRPDATVSPETTSTSLGDQSEEDWSAPDPSNFWASGLTIDAIPPGFAFEITEGTADLPRSSIFHTFASSDGTEFSIGRNRRGQPLSSPGEVVTVDGRDFTIVEYPSGETRVREEVAGGVSVEVVSRQMDTDTLLEIAKGVTYDPATDGDVGIRVIEGGIEFRNSRDSAIECSPPATGPVLGFTEGASSTQFPSVVLEPNQTRIVQLVLGEVTGELSFGVDCVDVSTGDLVYADGIKLTSPETSSAVSAPAVVLTSDGLGVIQFGAAPQDTIDALSSALGSPDEDSGWVAYSNYQPGFGVCGGTQWWMARWGQLGVLFTNGADSVYAPEDQPHFAMYGYGWWIGVPPDEIPLRTSAGLTLGDTKDETLALYGEAATFVAGDEIVQPYVRLDLDDANPQLALLDRQTLTIVQIRGGTSCGE